MGRKLENLVIKYIEIKKDEIINRDSKEDEQELFIESVKRTTIEDIHDEIKQEVYYEELERALKDARLIINREKIDSKVAAFKEIGLFGMIISFLLGLAVNQATEALGFLVPHDNALASTGAAFVFIILAVAIFIFAFCKEIYNLLKLGDKQ